VTSSGCRVQVKNVELKKLVYMYLVHNADANATCRELALLAINSFQRDLAGPNPVRLRPCVSLPAG
jgi:vesicle coat complex subunit